MKHSRFVKMLKSLGFELTKSKTSAKLCFFVFRKLSAEERAQVPTPAGLSFSVFACDRMPIGFISWLLLTGCRGQDGPQQRSPATTKKNTTSPSADAGERAGKRQKTRSPAPPQQRSGPSPRKSA